MLSTPLRLAPTNREPAGRLPDVTLTYIVFITSVFDLLVANQSTVRVRIDEVKSIRRLRCSSCPHPNGSILTDCTHSSRHTGEGRCLWLVWVPACDGKTRKMAACGRVRRNRCDGKR